ncbi:hypothetical protein JCM8547_002129 [Rhodosporidiobolus lusitaniae]
MSETTAHTALLLARHIATGLSATEEAETRMDPWAESSKYAKISSGVLAGAIAVFGLFNLTGRLLGSTQATRSPIYRRTVALYRYIETAQPKAIGPVRLPAVGTFLLIASFWLFTFIYALAVQPFYHSRWDVGSPPLAVRSGLLALGCFPIILALSTRVNLVSFVVGTSYEKLQVYQRWISYLFFLLSLMHAFPFVVQGTNETRHNDDGLNPDGLSQLEYAWRKRGMIYYWSGIAVTILLAARCLADFGPLRRVLPRLTKPVHFISTVLFIGFLFVHANKLLDSWNWLYAAVAIYGSSLLVQAVLFVVRNSRRISSNAQLEVLAENAVRITVGSPFGSSTGQKFLLYSTKALHVGSASCVAVSGSRDKSISFVLSITSPLSSRLHRIASSSAPTASLLLDGPHGNFGSRNFLRHDTVVTLVEATGMSFAMAIMEDAMAKVLAGGKVTKIEVHWAVSSAACTTWFHEQLSQLIARLDSQNKRDLVTLNLYNTTSTGFVNSNSSSDISTLVGSSEEEKLAKMDSSRSAESVASPGTWTTHSAPLEAAAILSSTFSSSPSGSTVAVAACGSSSLLTDARRAVAVKQRGIAFGRAREGVTEVELFTEELLC